MRLWQRGKHLLGRWLLAAGMVGAPGCACCFHAIDPPAPECVESCHAIPGCARSHVYVFFVNGLDPVDCANLTGLRDYVQALGFTKTYYGQLYHMFWFRDEICRLHKEDACARFVLVSFSEGAKVARSLARSAQAEGVNIDLVIFLDGKAGNDAEHSGGNIHRVINIVADGCLGRGKDIEGAENHHLGDAGHFGSPTHIETLTVLATELNQIAASVPIPPSSDPDWTPGTETAPTPRPVPPPKATSGDEWDFLNPVATLNTQPYALGLPASPGTSAGSQAHETHKFEARPTQLPRGTGQADR